MKRLFMIAAAIAALALGSVAAYATSVTVSPWAYACGHTTSGNPAEATDPGADCTHGTTGNVGYCKDSEGQPVADTPGGALASLASGRLTLTKDAPTCDDLSAGATIDQGRRAGGGKGGRRVLWWGVCGGWWGWGPPLAGGNALERGLTQTKTPPPPGGGGGGGGNKQRNFLPGTRYSRAGARLQS